MAGLHAAVSPFKRSLGDAAARLWLGALAVLAAYFLTPSAVTAETMPGIVVIYGADTGLPSTDTIRRGLRAVLSKEKGDGVDVFDEYLDVVRFPEAENLDAMTTLLSQRYSGRMIDVVVAIGPAALAFVTERKTKLFPSAKLVFAGIRADRLPGMVFPSGTSGITSKFDVVKTFELALKLQPDTQHVAVITGAAELDRSWEKEAKAKFGALSTQVSFNFLAGLPLATVLQRVASLPPHSIIIYLSMFEDGSGQKLVPRDIAHQIASAANSPTYGVYDTYVGKGIVGGFMDTFDAVGRATGTLVLEALSNTQSSGNPVREAETHKFVVDWGQMGRWGFDAARLPLDTEVRFRSPSLWDQHREQVLVGLAVVAIQSIFIIALLVQRRHRRSVERRLRESEERVAFAAQSAKLGLWQLDIASKHIWATSQCRRILGLGAHSTLTWQAFINAVHPEDRLRVKQACKRAIAQGESDEQEYRVVYPDGRVRWILNRARSVGNAADKPLHMTGVVLDITERKRAEEELRESEERYRNVVETQSELICRYLPDTTLTFVNDAYCRYFNRSRKDLVGGKWVDLIPESARVGVLDHVQALITHARTESYEHEVQRPDGTVGWQHWTDRVILDADGGPVEIQAIGRDLTELKQAEAEALRHRQELAHLTRVSVVGALSGALAHELNQPLTAILSNAQAAVRLISRDPVDAIEIGQILQDIVDDDKRAGHVIQHLRSLLKKDSATRTRIQVNDLITVSLAICHSDLILKGVPVSKRLAADLPEIDADPVQIQQVLLNLIMNACEAMNAKPAKDRLLLIKSERRDAMLRISVVDSGDGIPADAIKELYQPFFTTKSLGLGLGLPICKWIIEAHGGRLAAKNNSGGGATFFIELPIAEEQRHDCPVSDSVFG
jgi:PAS domain S-box-containing protein